METPDLIYTLGLFRATGATHVHGRAIPDIIRESLKQLDGKSINTFFSYRVETLLSFGPIDNNCLLDGFSEAEIAHVIEACDTTSIYDPATKELINLPVNFWGVLARVNTSVSN